MQFKCCQTKHAILQLWKDDIKNFTGNLNNLSIQDHHLIPSLSISGTSVENGLLKCHRILNLKKHNSRELYKIQLSLIYEKPKIPQ